MEQSQDIKLTCSQDKVAVFLCGSPSCKESALICNDPECQCQVSQHERCRCFKLKPILMDITKKTISSDEAKSLDTIEDIITQHIEQLSKYRQRTRIKKRTLNLKENSCKMVTMIAENHLKELTGELVSKTMQQLESPSQNSNIKNKTQILSVWNAKKKDLINFFQIIQISMQHPPLLSLEPQNSKNTLNKPTNVQILNKSKNLWEINSQQVYANKASKNVRNVKEVEDQADLIPKDRNVSNIITNISEFITWFGKQLLNLKLLYRASQQNFSVSSFHAKCDNIPNTLVLIRTQNDKIIGGFTPLIWKPFQEDFVPDQSYRTCLFSYTNQEKYYIINETQCSYAIFRSRQYGPTFGRGHDLYISENANRERKSFCDFPVSFNNGKYSKSQDSSTAFCGTEEGYKFIIKEWEVFHAIFDTK